MAKGSASTRLAPTRLALVLLLVVCAITAGPLLSGSLPHWAGHTDCSEHSCAGGGAATAAARALQTNGSGSPQIIFQCPDGRLGLHVVHTRFLITQAGANRVFMASRLQLMRTFTVPSLNAQTSQAFVLYASYDARLKPGVLHAFTEALDAVSVHTVINPERQTSMELNYTTLAAKLQHLDPRVHDVDLFITSRIDIDDAVHRGAAEGVQRYACSGGAGAGDDQRVRVSYVQRGQLWFPSTSPKAVHGMVGVWQHLRWENALYRVLAIMQSMVVSGRHFMRRCPLDVYAYPHYMPLDLEKLRLNVTGCRFKFRTKTHIHYWEPPEGDLGNLYIRTASSWTWNKEDLLYKLQPANVTQVVASFGIEPAALSLANIMFAGFEHDAPELLEKSSALKIER